MTIENGGLWFVPGSHHQLLPHRQVNNPMVYQGEPETPTFSTAEVGDIVLFSSLTLHKTTPNTTEGIRWAYVIEYMSTNDYDPGIAPPFLKVAKQGQPHAEFVQSYRGRNLINRLKHRLLRREISQILEWQ